MTSKFFIAFDPDAPDIVAPDNMAETIDSYCRDTNQKVPTKHGGNITVNITEHIDVAMKTLPAIGTPVAIGLTLPNLKGYWFYCKGTNKRMRDLARRPMENGSIIHSNTRFPMEK